MLHRPTVEGSSLGHGASNVGAFPVCAAVELHDQADHHAGGRHLCRRQPLHVSYFICWRGTGAGGPFFGSWLWPPPCSPPGSGKR
jgi:hypothetical protein